MTRVVTAIPNLVPHSLQATAEIDAELAGVLQETTGQEVPAIVDKLVDSKRQDCKAGDCALKGLCELVPGYVSPADTSDPMNAYPEETVPARHRILVDCDPKKCADLKTTGITVKELAKLGDNALAAHSAAKTAGEHLLVAGDNEARKALELGEAAAAGLLAAAEISAKEAKAPFEDRAEVIRAQAQTKAIVAEAEVLDQFRQSVTWLA